MPCQDLWLAGLSSALPAGEAAHADMGAGAMGFGALPGSVRVAVGDDLAGVARVGAGWGPQQAGGADRSAAELPLSIGEAIPVCTGNVRQLNLKGETMSTASGCNGQPGHPGTLCIHALPCLSDFRT